MEINTENKRQMIILALALGVGLIATLLASQVIEKRIHRQTRQLAADYEKKSAADKQAIKKELSTLYKELDNKIKKAVESVQQQEQQEVKREEKPIVPPLSTRTPPGKRAMTIRIDPLSAVGGLINPGDFVDVLAELEVENPQKPKDDKDEVTSVIFQNIQVLAVNSNFRPSDNPEALAQRQDSKFLNVTLALTPEEAGLLTFAQQNGKIRLSLRGYEEKGKQDLTVASWESLAEFVEREQGTKLIVPQKPADLDEDEEEEVKPFIQIFKSGYESR